jgi:membrane fusion protein (multidrug efflux system)
VTGARSLVAVVGRTGAVLLLGAALATGCGREKKDAAIPPAEVTVVTVSPQDVPVSAEYVAQTQGSCMVSIQARVNGFLKRRVCTEGAFVKEGDVHFGALPNHDTPFRAGPRGAPGGGQRLESGKYPRPACTARVR